MASMWAIKIFAGAQPAYIPATLWSILPLPPSENQRKENSTVGHVPSCSLEELAGTCPPMVLSVDHVENKHR